MTQSDFRAAIASYILQHAQPPDKYSHQPRLYQLACRIGEGETYDDDILYAAAWLHDLGVFLGHRPSDPAELASWDNVAYAVRSVPALLSEWRFPAQKVPAVVESIATHLPTGNPTGIEGVLLRDADILEQLGAIGALRMISKVGRDTRYPTFGEALRQLERSVHTLLAQLHTETARRLAETRIATLRAFLDAAYEEASGAPL